MSGHGHSPIPGDTVMFYKTQEVTRIWRKLEESLHILCILSSTLLSKEQQCKSTQTTLKKQWNEQQIQQDHSQCGQVSLSPIASVDYSQYGLIWGLYGANRSYEGTDGPLLKVWAAKSGPPDSRWQLKLLYVPLPTLRHPSAFLGIFLKMVNL